MLKSPHSPPPTSMEGGRSVGTYKVRKFVVKIFPQYSSRRFLLNKTKPKKKKKPKVIDKGESVFKNTFEMKISSVRKNLLVILGSDIYKPRKNPYTKLTRPVLCPFHGAGRSAR